MKKFSITYFACIFLSPASPARLPDKVRDLRNECKLNDAKFGNNGEFNTQVAWFWYSNRWHQLRSGPYYKSFHQ